MIQAVTNFYAHQALHNMFCIDALGGERWSESESGCTVEKSV